MKEEDGGVRLPDNLRWISSGGGSKGSSTEGGRATAATARMGGGDGYGHGGKKMSRNRYFAVGSADSLVSLWNVKELLCIKTFSKLEWPVRTVSFNHTGEFIAYAS